jgi:hypothetical protein
MDSASGERSQLEQAVFEKSAMVTMSEWGDDTAREEYGYAEATAP